MRPDASNPHASESDTSRSDAPQSDALILTRRDGAITRITLNRPRAINALNLEMFETLTRDLAAANADGSSAVWLDGAGDRGFCGGGDVKEISTGDPRQILSTEYVLDHAVATSGIPVVGIMDGITMGGGIGLTGHAAIRVVTERSRLAMPEARIGIVPDVGGHLLLARAPGRLGELLAITSGEMDAGDAIALGFADAYVPSDRLERLRRTLASGEDPETAVAGVAEPAPPSRMLQEMTWWEPIAALALGNGGIGDGGIGETADIRADAALDGAVRLIAALEHDPNPIAQGVASVVRAMCPTSIVVTLAQIARTRADALSLAEVLADDLRVVVRLAHRPDFAEGVRAQVIEKDRNPAWNPGRIEDLDPAEIRRILAPLHDDEVALAL